MAQDLLKDTVSTVSVLVVTIFLLISFPFFPVVCSFFLNATFLGVTLLAICFDLGQYFFCPFTRVAGHLFCLEATRDRFCSTVRSQEQRRLVGIDSFDVKGSSDDQDDSEECSLAEGC